jgi:acetylornithine deacetylase/succinyl-diaminopimelate desuccinylase-like protein
MNHNTKERAREIANALGAYIDYTCRDVWRIRFVFSGYDCGIAIGNNGEQMTFDVYRPRVRSDAYTTIADNKWNELKTSIRFNPSRDVEKIVADIRRRIDWAGADAMRVEYNRLDCEAFERLNAHNETVAKIAQATGLPKWENKSEKRAEFTANDRNDCHAKITVLHNAVSFSISGVETESPLFEMLCRILAAK